MLLTTNYVTPDNQSSISIEQQRNTGYLIFSSLFKISNQKRMDGKGFIDALFLEEPSPNELFITDSKPLWEGDYLVDYQN